RLAAPSNRRDVSLLVLFDVDGTLLLTHDEVYVEANRLALTEVYGDAPEGPDVPGDTATAHTRRALTDAGFSTEQIDAGLGRWCETFAAQYVRLLAAADTSHWQLGAGAHAAGCRCIAVATGRYGRDELGAADAVIPDLTTLSSALAAVE